MSIKVQSFDELMTPFYKWMWVMKKGDPLLNIARVIGVDSLLILMQISHERSGN